MASAEVRPATDSSRGDNKLEQWGITRESTLNAPMNERRPLTVFGGSQVDNAVSLWVVAVKVPCCYFQPRTEVDFGAITVFEAERRREEFESANKTFSQFFKSSIGVSLPQYKSSAIMTTQPSTIRSPSTAHISSSRAVSDPGIPIALLVYTLIPRNGVATPQYLRDDLSNGI